MKKLVALLLALCLLCGCQLASEEKNEDRMTDKLVGVFITFDHLDLSFDLEGYVRDHGIPEGEIDGTEYQERLFAEVGERGWSFPGYEGILMGQMWEEDHWLGFSTEGFCDRQSYVERTDTLDSIAETGIIYVPKGTEVLLCPNPVYMTPDGEYYTVAGQGFAGFVDGGAMSQSVEEETVISENGAESTYRAKFTVEVQSVELADRVVFIHMTADHAELKREEYAPDALPESIVPENGAAYLIVEEYTGDSVKRTLNQPGDDAVVVYTKTEQVYCLPRFTEIVWNE